MIDEMKYFTQLLLAKKQLKETEAKNAFHELLVAKAQRDQEEGEEAQDIQLDQEEFLSKIKGINKNLAFVNLKIERIICEISNEMYYCVVPTCHKEEALKLTTFGEKSENGMALVKKIIVHILEEGTGTISDEYVEQYRQACLLSPVDVDKIIDKLIDDKYVERLQSDELALTPLCVAESMTFLKLNYKDILKKCKLCSNITVKPSSCRSCEMNAHKLCLAKLFANLKGDRAGKCPECKKPWVE